MLTEDNDSSFFFSSLWIHFKSSLSGKWSIEGANVSQSKKMYDNLGKLNIYAALQYKIQVLTELYYDFIAVYHQKSRLCFCCVTAMTLLIEFDQFLKH